MQRELQAELDQAAAVDALVSREQSVYPQEETRRALILPVGEVTENSGTVDPPVGIEGQTRVLYPESLLGDQSRGGSAVGTLQQRRPESCGRG